MLTALRRACLARAAVPVLCGASLRGIGVEPLLDSVSTFLPSPLDRPRPCGAFRSVYSGGGGGRGAGGAAGKKRSGKGVGNSGSERTGSGSVGGTTARGMRGDAGVDDLVEVDPLQDELVAFVFKVRSSSCGNGGSGSEIVGGIAGGRRELAPVVF